MKSAQQEIVDWLSTSVDDLHSDMFHATLAQRPLIERAAEVAESRGMKSKARVLRSTLRRLDRGAK